MKYIILDIETTGLNPRLDRIHGIGIAWKNRDGEILSEYLEPDNSDIRYYLTNPEHHVVGHNLRFDLKFLIQNGFDIKAQIWDTKLLAQLIDENQELGLKALSLKYFGAGSLVGKHEIDDAITKIKGRSVGDLCRADLDDSTHPYKELIAKYCKEDCVNTLKLFNLFSAKLRLLAQQLHQEGVQMTPLSYYMDEAMPLERVLLEMELRGIKVKEEELRSYRNTLIQQNEITLEKLNSFCYNEINSIEEGMYEKEIEKRKSEQGKAKVKKSSTEHNTKFNWQSANHLSTLIFDQYRIPKNTVEFTKTGKPSTSESSLEELRQSRKEADPVYKILTLYKDYKKNQKLITTYTGEDRGLLSQIDGGRIYAEYLQTGRGREESSGGTVTGRLSSRNPNMQNLPRDSKIKSFFIPDEDHVFVYFDYSQLELRLAAHLSQDRLLIKAYKNNQDLHELTAKAIGSDRQTGKQTNFAMIYDASAYRLSAIVNKSVGECQNIINEFYKLYAGYKNYLQQQQQFMVINGCVISDAGRIRRLHGACANDPGSKEWRHIIKQGYNFPIQSLGASITKRAMIELHRRGFKILTSVHDSVVIQIHKNELYKTKEIQGVAETIYPLTVPLKADIKILTSLLESDTLKTEGEKNESNTTNYY